MADAIAVLVAWLIGVVAGWQIRDMRARRLPSIADEIRDALSGLHLAAADLYQATGIGLRDLRPVLDDMVRTGEIRAYDKRGVRLYARNRQESER